ncbi:glycosyltransferase family 2 protein [Bernardetia sp. ABR2-2B]|uniref:glycosyltransferase family 2 protein n=1 Tax=Bernardetia sp. ABR2-2B TaxID=3127472 RepID=UPI0030D0A228
MHKLQPKVSIITPLFNRQELIKETHQSVISQTYKNWEWIIVDDGSKDNSWKVIKSFAQKDNRIKIIERNRMPKGATTCRNIGLETAKGKYVMFLDSDDLLVDFCLEQRVEYMQTEHDKYSFLVFPISTFNKKSKTAQERYIFNLPRQENDINRFLQKDYPWQTSSSLFLREIIPKWNEKLPIYQDIDLHIHILSLRHNYRFVYTKPDVLLRDDVLEDRISSQSNFSLKVLYAKRDLLQDIWKYIKENNKDSKEVKQDFSIFADNFMINMLQSNNTDIFYRLVYSLWREEFYTTREAFKKIAILPVIDNALHYTPLPLPLRFVRKFLNWQKVDLNYHRLRDNTATIGTVLEKEYIASLK